jgi:transcriptional regulator with XRE-family HTH domain
MDLRTRVGRNIRRLRVGLMMSQEALAADAKLEAVHVSRIERGLANPTLGVLKRVADALDVDAGELFRVDTARSPSANLTRGRKPRPRRRPSGARHRA